MHKGRSWHIVLSSAKSVKNAGRQRTGLRGGSGPAFTAFVPGQVLNKFISAAMPIKRDEFLAPLSREHHDGLLLCWKIRTGFRKNISVDRIQSYAVWFFENHLLDHFDVEEKYVFSVLGNEHDLVKRALKEHRQLRRLFEGIHDDPKNLSLIEEKLDAHIRFEERVLFNEIQAIASPAKLEEISVLHANHAETDTTEVWEDEFWK